MIIATAALLVGVWNYEAYEYKGQIKPPAQTDRMTYEFRADGTDRLYWDLLDPGNFCERFGRYDFKDGFLSDSVESVNPANHSSCSTDPDMSVGNKTTTPARFEKDKLVLTLSLGEDEIQLIFGKVPANPATSELATVTTP